MPNWCMTTIRFDSENKEMLNDFRSKLEECMKVNDWLYSVVDYFNLTNDNVSYRGTLLDIRDYEDCVVIDTETAWIPMLKMFKLINERYYDNQFCISWLAEESGCGIYNTNDKMVWEDRIKIDYYLNDKFGEDYFNTDNDALERINQLLTDSGYNKIDNLKSEYIELNDDDFLQIYVLEEVSDDYFD